MARVVAFVALINTSQHLRFSQKSFKSIRGEVTNLLFLNVFFLLDFFFLIIFFKEINEN